MSSPRRPAPLGCRSVSAGELLCRSPATSPPRAGWRSSTLPPAAAPTAGARYARRSSNATRRSRTRTSQRPPSSALARTEWSRPRSARSRRGCARRRATTATLSSSWNRTSTAPSSPSRSRRTCRPGWRPPRPGRRASRPRRASATSTRPSASTTRARRSSASTGGTATRDGPRGLPPMRAASPASALSFRTSCVPVASSIGRWSLRARSTRPTLDTLRACAATVRPSSSPTRPTDAPRRRGQRSTRSPLTRSSSSASSRTS